jgi:hypothetical protein
VTPHYHTTVVIPKAEGVQKDFFNRRVRKEGIKCAKINSFIPILCGLSEKTLRSLRLIYSDFLDTLDPLNYYPEILIKSPSPDDLKTKIKKEFFLNPLPAFPLFPYRIIVPSLYFIRYLFGICSVLVRLLPNKY